MSPPVQVEFIPLQPFPGNSMAVQVDADQQPDDRASLCSSDTSQVRRFDELSQQSLLLRSNMPNFTLPGYNYLGPGNTDLS